MLCLKEEKRCYQKMCPDRVCLRSGDQPATPGHSIPRQAAREARRQEPPRWQRTWGGIQNWQLLGEKGAQATGGLSRRAETAAPSTREGRQAREESGKDQGRGRTLPLRVWLWIWSEHGLFKASKAAGLLLELQNGSRWKTFSARVSPGDPASPRNLSRPTPHPLPRPPAPGSPPWSPRQTFGP